MKKIVTFSVIAVLVLVFANILEAQELSVYKKEGSFLVKKNYALVSSKTELLPKELLNIEESEIALLTHGQKIVRSISHKPVFSFFVLKYKKVYSYNDGKIAERIGFDWVSIILLPVFQILAFFLLVLVGKAVIDISGNRVLPILISVGTFIFLMFFLLPWIGIPDFIYIQNWINIPNGLIVAVVLFWFYRRKKEKEKKEEKYRRVSASRRVLA